MASHRHERVSELLKREIGEAIRQEIAVDDAGLITVVDLTLAGDMQSAVVFVSVLGAARQKERALDVLERNRALIQSRLAARVSLKHTPKLKFKFDEVIDRGDRVMKLIEEIETTLPPSNEGSPKSH